MPAALSGSIPLPGKETVASIQDRQDSGRRRGDYAPDPGNHTPPADQGTSPYARRRKSRRRKAREQTQARWAAYQAALDANPQYQRAADLHPDDRPKRKAPR